MTGVGGLDLNGLRHLIARLKVTPSRIVVYVLLGVASVIEGYPLVWLVFNSFKEEYELYTNRWGLPLKATIENYVVAWDRGGVGTSLVNSIIVTGITVTLVLSIGSITGYTLARMRVPGGGLVFATCLLAMFIQGDATILGLFVITKTLSIIDTYAALILPYTAAMLPLAIILFTTYFRGLPLELEEAALVDGASRPNLFLRIVAPLSGPVFSAAAIFTFIASWNDFMIALLLLKPRTLRTLPVAISQLGVQYVPDAAAQFAGLAIATVPVIVFYVIFQKRFVAGLLGGALKG